VSANLWHIVQDARGWWWVYGPDGQFRIARRSREAAAYDVQMFLGSSGGYYGVTEFGGVPVWIAAPRLGARPGAPPSATFGLEQAEPAVQKAAEAVDKIIGRKAPDDPLDQVKSIEVSKIVPESVRKSTTFKEINQGVATGSAGLAVVGVIFGSGTAAAAVSGVAVAFSTKTTVGSYLTFGQAFLVTLALSASTALLTYFTYKGQMKSYGAVGLWLLATLVITGATQALGFPGPTVAQLESAAGGHNPILAAVLMLAEFLAFYTLVPFLGGLITGVITGRVIFKLSA
jgi:hypothetical protein